MNNILIEPVLNGWKVQCGCQQVVFTDVDKLCGLPGIRMSVICSETGLNKPLGNPAQASARRGAQKVEQEAAPPTAGENPAFPEK